MRRPGQDPRAFIALGSNLGDSPEILRAAFTALREIAQSDFATSSLWQSTPVDCPPGSPTFLNAVAAFLPRPDETPERLLMRLQHLEKHFGRRPKQVMNEARPLDLDLIGYGSQTRHTPDLILPHPRAHLRSFVLAPLAEIAPDLQLPAWPATARQLLAASPADPGLRQLER
jgi:2-amino-4-hydroxy-6-hydroxymethyldihydropteridine diphosphokinase